MGNLQSPLCGRKGRRTQLEPKCHVACALPKGATGRAKVRPFYPSPEYHTRKKRLPANALRRRPRLEHFLAPRASLA